MPQVEFPARSKTGQAYHKLRELIESGHIGGGERLTEAKACRMLSMGRGPVRESILKLEAEGILKHQANSSRVVVHVEDEDPDVLLKRYELREVIESGAARLAALNMTGWQAKRLLEMAERVDEVWTSDGNEAFYKANREFLRFLIRHCGNEFFWKVWKQEHLEPLSCQTGDFKEKFSSQVSEDHRRMQAVELARAIVAHDPEKAEELARCAVHEVCETMRKILWDRLSE